MFCKWCGKEIDSDLNFCSFCGKSTRKGEIEEAKVNKSAGISTQTANQTPNMHSNTEDHKRPKNKAIALAIILGIVCFILLAAVVLISLGIIDVSIDSLFKKGSSSGESSESSSTDGVQNADTGKDNILYWPVDDLPNGVPEIEGVVLTSIESSGDKGALTIAYEECDYQEAKKYANKLVELGWDLLINLGTEDTLNVMIENDQNETILFNWSEATNSGEIIYGFATHINNTSGEDDETEETVDDSSPDFIIDIEDPTLEAAINFALERLGENVQDGITVEEMSKLKYLSIHNTVNDVEGNNYLENLGWFLDITGIELQDCYFTEDPIENIEALKYAVNLEGLLISGYDISDITPLSSLIKLEILVLPHNNISDLRPLSSLENVWLLNLVGNNISDISPLAGTNIEDLEIFENNITDFSPLNECKELRIVHIDEDGENDIDMIDN